METQSMKKKIMLVIGGGGFFFQSTCLLKKIEHDYDCIVAIPEDSKMLIDIIMQKFPNCSEIVTIPPVTTISMEKNKIRIVGAYLKTFFSSIKLLNSIKPDAIIIVASSIALPTFLIAKIKGIKTIFIESITRVDQLSITGKLLARFALADRFYVQWPGLAKQYTKAIYKGTVL